VRPQDRAAHEWYRFVLSFPPHLIRDYVARLGVTTGAKILDPFCGTGTTLVECKKLGIESVGIDRNPMGWFASRVKIDWKVDASALVSHATEIAERTARQLESQDFTDCLCSHSCARSLRGDGRLKVLAPDARRLLLKGSISALPLHKTLVLLENLERGRWSGFYAHERLALAKAIVTDISNLRFGPEVGVGRPRLDAPVVESWLECVRTMADDLKELRSYRNSRSMVHRADARECSAAIPARSIDAVITSPPYPNEKDYTRTTRLESVLLGFLNSKHDLRSLKRELMRSNTRNVYKHDNDECMVSGNGRINLLAEQIEQKRIELQKTSGFERLYARVTKLYFGGMARHLSELRKVLKPGARLAYVVGDQASYFRVKIPTGQLLAELAESLGYKVEGIDLFRTRFATATGESLREEVVVLRRD
jgi:tRNA G10  N-methylase Trm11